MNTLRTVSFRAAIFLLGLCSYVNCFSINVSRNADTWLTLFPATCYSRALEICMRVLCDKAYESDAITAQDLCVGRLIRLSYEIKAMERIHKTGKQYPPEDIEYLTHILNKVTTERVCDLKSSIARSLVNTIQSAAARLMP